MIRSLPQLFWAWLPIWVSLLPSVTLVQRACAYSILFSSIALNVDVAVVPLRLLPEARVWGQRLALLVVPL